MKTWITLRNWLAEKPSLVQPNQWAIIDPHLDKISLLSHDGRIWFGGAGSIDVERFADGKIAVNSASHV